MQCHNREEKQKGNFSNYQLTHVIEHLMQTLGLRGLLPAATSVSKPHKQTKTGIKRELFSCMKGAACKKGGEGCMADPLHQRKCFQGSLEGHGLKY